MRQRENSYLFVFLLAIVFVILIFMFFYIKSFYFNSLAEKTLQKVVLFQLITYSKENFFLPLKINIEKNDDYLKFKDIVKTKKIYVITKVSDTYNSFITVIKHKYGNKIYGVDSDTFRIKYKDSYSGYKLSEGDCPNPHDNIDDLKGWIYIGKMDINGILLKR